MLPTCFPQVIHRLSKSFPQEWPEFSTGFYARSVTSRISWDFIEHSQFLWEFWAFKRSYVTEKCQKAWSLVLEAFFNKQFESFFIIDKPYPPQRRIIEPSAKRASSERKRLLLLTYQSGHYNRGSLFYASNHKCPGRNSWRTSWISQRVSWHPSSLGSRQSLLSRAIAISAAKWQKGRGSRSL